MAFITPVPGPSASSSSSTGNSSNTNNSTGSPNTSTSQMTHDQIVAGNLKRVANNTVLQQRRDAGEPNVSADELLIPTPPQPTGTALQQWIAAFAQLSPNSQNQGSAILTPKTDLLVTDQYCPLTLFTNINTQFAKLIRILAVRAKITGLLLVQGAKAHRKGCRSI
ncbi:hypothetical protein C8R48DRAFT_768776 [Suillus tomentosus]|nr:hypothetical protein C8R48DRAFT_768776 [Suillus tomentosus]